MSKENVGLKKRLPHGAMRAIAKTTGLSISTISQVLRGNTISMKQPEILKATAEYLDEYNAKEREAVKALNEALNPSAKMELSI